MALPTKADVHGAVTFVTYTYEMQDTPGGAWLPLTLGSGVGGTSVLGHSIQITASGEQDATTSPFVGRATEGQIALTMSGFYSDFPPIFAVRITANWPSGEAVIGVGYTESYEERDDGTITYSMACASAVIRRVALYSSLFVNRYAATATTATSIEDPDDLAYAGGMINWILWQAGGRPIEQAATYPSATYYYRCDYSDIILPFGWVAADDAWEELGRIVAAVGGWLYQDREGVVTYRSVSSILAEPQGPCNYVTFATTLANRENDLITMSGYSATTTVRTDPRSVAATFVTRERLFASEVYRNTEPIILQAGEVYDAVVELQYPVDDTEPITITIEAHRLRGGTLLSSTQVTQSGTVTTAQQITTTITNTLTEPIIITAIAVEAVAIAVVEEGSVRAPGIGNGRDLRIVDLALLGSRPRAQQLVDYAAATVGLSDSDVSLSLPSLRLDPYREIGEIVDIQVDNSFFSVSGESDLSYRIVAITYRDDGAMDLQLVSASSPSVFLDYWRFGANFIDSAFDTYTLFY